MELIDDEGNLFGVVNVVDALVVLLVVAVIAAGVALVNPFASSEDATRYATLDLGEQRPYVTELISEGDVLSPSNSDSNATVTDVYVTPSGDENATVTVRVRMDGQLVESGETGRSVFSLAGTTIQRGTNLRLGSDEYTIDGIVRSYAESGKSLQISETSITVSESVSTATAEAISRGDTFVVGGDTVATITDVHVAPGNSSNVRHVTVGATVETLNRSGPSFAGQRVSLGRNFSFRSDGYELTGEIQAVGNATVRTGTESVVLRASVSPETAQSIDEGDAYRIAGNEVARISTVRTYPSSKDGRLMAVLGMKLVTVDRSGEQYVGDRLVQVGTAIPFQSDSYQLTGNVVTQGSLSLPGEATTRSVEIQLESVAPEVADSLSTGMVERSGSTVSARVTDVQVDPAVVTLTSESGDIYRREHPVKKDVVLTVELSGRETPAGLYFHGEALQVGRTVLLDFSTVTVEGTVVRIPPTSTTNSTGTSVVG
ncbi:DUF4330 domain-containing protein [Halorubellus sp. PRR65]|uniref:DUF4330 domain-containing protein n=1 Tax=Halorubellus sp. PRR65 TaxID=3098148 RepID=UPI002B259B78|nr:DUF4330 domain-containing protein [Halorubellus sp. PRR65]